PFTKSELHLRPCLSDALAAKAGPDTARNHRIYFEDTLCACRCKQKYLLILLRLQTTAIGEVTKARHLIIIPYYTPGSPNTRLAHVSKRIRVQTQTPTSKGFRHAEQRRGLCAHTLWLRAFP